MVAFFSFLVFVIQSFAAASDFSVIQCTSEVESQDNVYKVCLQRIEKDDVLVIDRYLGSGEMEEEKVLLSELKFDEKVEGDRITSFVAKSLEDEDLVRAKNFVRTPSTDLK